MFKISSFIKQLPFLINLYIYYIILNKKIQLKGIQ
ncbi:hypothetical protein ZYGNAAKF_CDS0092 [Enterococcus phage VRE9_2]